MMQPMRVEWDEPDEAKRKAANEAVERDIAYMENNRTMGIEQALMNCRTPAERDEVWGRRHPDLHATITYFGTLLSVRYVPAQWGIAVSGELSLSRSISSRAVEMTRAKWVALIATATGTREMDPTTLRVMWPSAPGDPIGGRIEDDAVMRARRIASEYESERTVLRGRADIVETRKDPNDSDRDR